MDIKEIIAGIALLVALSNMLTIWISKHRDTTKADLFVAVVRLENEDKRQERLHDKLEKELDERLAALHNRMLQNEAALSHVRLELVQATVNVPTNAQLGAALDRALGPVAKHMERTEEFMRQIYRAGLLTHKPE